MNIKNKSKVATILSKLNILTITILAILLYIGGRNFWTPVGTSGESMHPTIKDGSVVILKVNNRLRPVTYNRGDIVSIEFTKPDTLQKDNWIKRIVAIPGDKVHMSNGYVYVNNELAYGTENLEFGQSIDPNSVKYYKDIEPTTLKDGQYIVLGDNRPVSNDSSKLLNHGDYNSFYIFEYNDMQGVVIFSPINFGPITALVVNAIMLGIYLLISTILYSILLFIKITFSNRYGK